ncbi:SGNH/GDSL hydrolase family protein [Azonexus sp. R2A61]|uniref:SGNH/GDSL hydrolase family protein n=1 Tax=Azonexus sp. R2A61 TaxID=2744443 RepID=UPI001F306A0D|nr:SGNH/GDSL hydrolase family protein [Azonexus sp. R2A61]
MTSFKTPARQKRESLLDKVLAPLTQAEREALRMAFISGISKSDIEALLDDVGLSNLVKYQNNDINGRITLLGPGGQPITPADLGWDIPNIVTAPTLVSAPSFSLAPQVGVPLSVTEAVFGGGAATVSTKILLDDAEIVGAGLSYTPITSDAGKTMKVRQTATNSAGYVTTTSAGAVVQAASSLPVPTNNLFSVLGDSRTQSATGDFPATGTINASGYIAWALQAMGYKAYASGNFGIGGSYMIPNNNATYSIRPRLPAVLADPASVVVFLCGVNDTSTPIETLIPEYTYCFQQITAAGKILVVCNELPKTGISEAERTAQLARKAWLESPACAAISPLIVQLDTFAPMLKSGTTCDFKDGYAPDNLHPATLGNSVLGATIGAKLAQLFAAQTAYYNAPTGADDYNSSTNPTGCLIPNYMMTGTAGTATGVNGQVATGWSFATGNAGGVTVDCSKGVDADGYDCQIIHVYGTPTAGSKTLAFQSLNQTAGNMGYIGSGDYIRSIARVKVDAGAVGFRGFGIGAKLQGNNGASVNKTKYNFAGTSSEWPSDLPFDAVCVSQRNDVYADWATMTSRGITALLNLAFTGGAPVDFTVRVSRFGVKK